MRIKKYAHEQALDAKPFEPSKNDFFRSDTNSNRMLTSDRSRVASRTRDVDLKGLA